MILPIIISFILLGCNNKKGIQANTDQDYQLHTKQYLAYEDSLQTYNQLLHKSEKDWLERRIPNMLGEYVMRAVLNDSMHYLTYGRLEEELKGIVNAHNILTVQYAQFTEEIQHWRLALESKEMDPRDAPSRVDDFSNEYQQLRSGDEQLRRTYQEWERNMNSFLTEVKERYDAEAKKVEAERKKEETEKKE